MKQLWYSSPARRWREALPLGNGHTGVMVYGGKSKETLCFNDSTLWSGYPKDYNNPSGPEHLRRVRELIFSGDNAAAQRLAEQELGGFYSETFLPLGSVSLRLRGLSCKEYRRELCLRHAVHTVTTADSRREAFASFPDKVVVYHIESPHPFSVSIHMRSKLRHTVEADGGLNLLGNAPDYAAPNYVLGERHPIRYGEGKGMAFALRCEAQTDGVVKSAGKRLLVENATCLTLYFTTATGFLGYNQMPQTSRAAVLGKCLKQLSSVHKDYPAVKRRHIADFGAILGASDLSFGKESSQSTNRLLKRAKRGEVTPALLQLFYHYGKYLLASGSREGGQPLNLQGQWNNALRPPWSSNYTVNINTQMNYWGASRANMEPCLEPLVRMVRETVQTGRQTAKTNYGCAGFACNHNVDIWRKTPPVKGKAAYMLEPLCGVWLANELYTHFKNGALSSYAGDIRTVVREAALFAADYLVPYEGSLVVCPSPSPENQFLKNGTRCALDIASAFDMGLVRQVFSNYLALHEEDELTRRIRKLQPKLYDFQDSKDGILEWHQDFPLPEPGHRHFSPLYAFYPGTEIQYYRDPALTGSVRKRFLQRMQHTTQHIGWSAAWGVCLAARLHDAGTAYEIAQNFLSHAVFKNLFCVHPPYYFQIDGNLGWVAGVHEMLIYEENGVIELLPALPPTLSSGFAEHLLVNGAALSFRWSAGMVTEIKAEQPVRILQVRIAPDCKTSALVQWASTIFKGT